MAPVLELCPTLSIGVAEFEELLPVELGLEEVVGKTNDVEPAEVVPDGLRFVPGPSSGLSIRNKRGVRQKSGGRGRWGKKGEKYLPPTAIERLAFQLFSFWDVL